MDFDISLEKISRRRRRTTNDGKAILTGVSARIAPHRWTLLAGPGGLGKSTLLCVIGGLWADYSGSWTAPKGSSLLLHQCAYLCGNTLADIFSYPSESRSEEGVYRDLLALVGLEKWQDSLHERQNWVQPLSAGGQQRIAIARALFLRPDYPYSDENTSVLDSGSERKLMTLLKGRLPETTVVVVSHQSELTDMYDEVLDLAQFKVAEG